MVKKVLIIVVGIGFLLGYAFAPPSLFKKALLEVEYVQVTELPEVQNCLKIKDFLVKSVILSSEFRAFSKQLLEKKNAQIKFVKIKEQDSVVLDVRFDQLTSQQMSVKIWGFSEKVNPEVTKLVQSLLSEKSHFMRNSLILAAAAVLGLGLVHKDAIKYGCYRDKRTAAGRDSSNIHLCMELFAFFQKKCDEYELNFDFYIYNANNPMYKYIRKSNCEKPIISIRIATLSDLFKVDRTNALVLLGEYSLPESEHSSDGITFSSCSLESLWVEDYSPCTKGAVQYDSDFRASNQNVRRLIFVVGDDIPGKTFAQAFKVAYDNCPDSNKHLLAKQFNFMDRDDHQTIGQPYGELVDDLSNCVMFVGLGGLSVSEPGFPSSIYTSKKYSRTVESSLAPINTTTNHINRVMRGSRAHSWKDSNLLLAEQAFNQLIGTSITDSIWNTKFDTKLRFMGAI